MLLTDIRENKISQRIGNIVDILMEERPIFQEDLEHEEIMQRLVKLVRENLTFDDFNGMQDQELKEHCSFVMATEVMSKIGQSWTQEETANFDEAIKRK